VFISVKTVFYNHRDDKYLLAVLYQYSD